MAEEDRRVGVAVDFSVCSRLAVKWAVENLLRSGDNLILINVHSTSTVHYEEDESQLWESTGSPFIPLHELSDPIVTKKYGIKPDPETLDLLHEAAKHKEVVIALKIYWGDARDKICEAINDIPLSCLVVGSRGLGKLRRALMGSVSNYVVNHANCPVTVVKHGEGEE